MPWLYKCALTCMSIFQFLYVAIYASQAIMCMRVCLYVPTLSLPAMLALNICLQYMCALLTSPVPDGNWSLSLRLLAAAAISIMGARAIRTRSIETAAAAAAGSIYIAMEAGSSLIQCMALPAYSQLVYQTSSSGTVHCTGLQHFHDFLSHCIRILNSCS